ncbi:MAG: 50S ribosomal protein L21 [Ignavibacteriae bacterium]|nr:50S ribosomal protein L21 [Ignavibacteriota bacterium]
MYAIVEIAGQQYKVTSKEKIFVPLLPAEVGSKVKFDKVLLVGDEKKTTIGQPYVKGASVEGKVLQHKKDDKVIVFKKKKRKGYRVRKGHRQQFTQVEITAVA